MEQSQSKPVFPAGVYGITAAKFSAGRSNLEVVRQMIAGGIRLIQYREKRPHKSFAEMLDECRAIRQLTREAGAVFIVNDYPDIAQLVDADGVHVGQDDFPVAEVRRPVRPNKLVGLAGDELRQTVQAPLAKACFILAREFGWTPEQCAGLTMGQILLYLEMLGTNQEETH